MNTESADNEVPLCTPITLKCISSAWTPALNLGVVIQLAAGQECECLIDISNCLCHSLKSWSPQTCSFGTLPFHLDIPSFSSCSSERPSHHGLLSVKYPTHAICQQNQLAAPEKSIQTLSFLALFTITVLVARIWLFRCEMEAAGGFWAKRCFPPRSLPDISVPTTLFLVVPQKPEENEHL